MHRVEVIGLGDMGSGPAKNLIASGFEAGRTRYPDGDNRVVTRVIEDLVGVELHR